MNPDHYHSMTDEQIAEWHQSRQRVARLTTDLVESRKATEAVQAAAEVERSKLLGQLNRSDLTTLNLTAKIAELQSVNRRLCGEQVQVLRALDALVRACDGVKVDDDTSPDPETWWKVLREAHDVLALNSIPF